MAYRINALLDDDDDTQAALSAGDPVFVRHPDRFDVEEHRYFNGKPAAFLSPKKKEGYKFAGILGSHPSEICESGVFACDIIVYGPSRVRGSTNFVTENNEKLVLDGKFIASIISSEKWGSQQYHMCFVSPDPEIWE